MATAQLARTLADLDPYVEQWDALAVAASRPLMRPALLLSWWQGQRELSACSELRVALVLDGHDLIGALPLFVVDPAARRPVYEVLGAGAFWGYTPLLAADAPPETLGLLTEALAASCPPPAMVSLSAVDASHDWPRRISKLWPPRGAWVYTGVGADPCLTVTLEGDFDQWLRSTGGHREHWRRLRRIGERGVTMRRSTTAAEFRTDLASLTRLHHTRWANKSQWLSPPVESALERAGCALIDSGAVRLWILDGEDGVVGATLFLTAGRETCCVMTAYDRAWGAYGPGVATAVAGIQDAFARGDRLVDLGYGQYEYKRGLANSARPVAWLRLFPRGGTYPLARICWAPHHAHERLVRLRVRLRARQRLNEMRARLPIRGSR